MLKMSDAGCPCPSPGISGQFTLKMSDAAGNRQKNSLKTPILEVRGHSRSSKLKQIKSLSLLLITISSMFVPICNFFYTKRANNGQITSFRGVNLFDALVRGKPRTQGQEILSRKTRDSWCDSPW